MSQQQVQIAAKFDYPFNEADARAAYEEWGCNCGPCALAFALQTTLDVVRPALPDFDARRYTSPTMMHEALLKLGRSFNAVRSPAKYLGEFNRQIGHANMFRGPMSLVRIQWTGPWTASGKPMKWAARQTHWICCWGNYQVFDVNGGVQRFSTWRRDIVPAIVATIDRADGDWYPANVWQLIEPDELTPKETP